MGAILLPLALSAQEKEKQEEDEDRRFAEEEAEFELAESAATDDFFGEGIAWKPGSTVETSVDRRIRKAREERGLQLQDKKKAG
jgi:ribosome-binding protein aMBF1 (putative translation factor)